MRSGTLAIISTTLSSDASVTEGKRREIMSLCSGASGEASDDVTPNEAAALLQCSYRTVMRHVISKKLKARKTRSGRYILSRKDILDFQG